MLDNLREKILSNPLITEHVIGQSEQGRDMYVWEIATEETEQKNSPRVYVQAGIHPSETTSYYVVEGFLDWIFSDSEEAKELLSMAVISIVPMCNPDGVALGNYRTNSKSVNLEMEYSAPYNSQVKETIAIVQLVEKYMGDSSSPGAHPIQILMNLHSTHGDDYPYHFHHYPYYLLDFIRLFIYSLSLFSLSLSLFIFSSFLILNNQINHFFLKKIIKESMELVSPLKFFTSKKVGSKFSRKKANLFLKE